MQKVIKIETEGLRYLIKQAVRLNRGLKIEATEQLRDWTGFGIKTALALVDAEIRRRSPLDELEILLILLENEG